MSAPHATATRAGLVATAALLPVYGASLARGVTWWDAGEFLAAIHSLGIPHPPGTPVFVLVARVWALILAPVLGFTVAVNALSAACTALACGLVAMLLARWLRDPVAGGAAGIAAGAGSTLWLNATETEVYAMTLVLAFALVAVADQVRVTREWRWAVLAAYLVGLAWALHLTALLTVPAAVVLAAPELRRMPPRWWARAVLATMLGATAVLYLYVRAQHDPAVNQGNPDTLPALWAVITRAQYDVAPLWPRRAPLWLQFGNVFEYADWQFALGLHAAPGPAWTRTSVTVCYALLGVAGSVWHRRTDRESWRAWLVLLLTTSVGVVLYLNLRAGASYGAGVLPPGALHEARDRDYFFTWAWVAWGAWAGVGCVWLARTLAHRVAPRATRSALAAGAGLLLAAAPIALNWPVIRHERVDEQRRATAAGPALLDLLPPRAVFLAAGDNDTYPLWYAQQVLGIRRDVIVVPVPLLTTRWYRAELRRRHALLGAATVQSWRGFGPTVDSLVTRAAAEGRPVIHSPMTGATPAI